jgi:hypothetical protein
VLSGVQRMPAPHDGHDTLGPASIKLFHPGTSGAKNGGVKLVSHPSQIVEIDLIDGIDTLFGGKLVLSLN